MTGISCVDCIQEGVTAKRPAPYGGPRSARCFTHHRAVVKRRKERAHELRTANTYQLTAEDYQLLYASQGSRCAICQRATGAARRLAVDHEHNRPGCDHPTEQGCHLCIRGLCCGPCNVLIGRYPVEALRRAIQYLTDPPARKTLLAT